MINSTHRGFSLMEAIVGIAVFLIIVVALLEAYAQYVKAVTKVVPLVKVAHLLDEGIEATRILRDNDWLNISSRTSGSEYYLTFANGSWSLGAAPVLIDSKYTRKIIFYDVYRDISHNIASAGTLDPNIKRVKVVVSWPVGSGNASREAQSYIANIF